MTNININITELFSSNLNLEGYFVLYCLKHKSKALLSKYINKCRKIDTEIFLELQKQGFIEIKASLEPIILRYESLTLTDKGSQRVEAVSEIPTKDSLQSDSNSNATTGFAAFAQCYPNVVKNGTDKRRLHDNLPRSKRLYNELLLETTHDILCKTAKAYHKEHVDRNSEIFMKAMPTWLQQKMYLTYLDKIDETDEEITNLDAI